MPSWSIGYPERERLELRLLSRPAKDEHYDWVSAEAHIAVGGFSGDTKLSVTASEMREFLAKLETLYRDLKGQAEFVTVEDQIRINVAVDRLGHVKVTGHLKDDAGFGNTFRFELAFDQTTLGHTISELRVALHELGSM
jgi:hypothetical protein